MSDDPRALGIPALRGQLAELGSAVRQLNQSGLDSATARLLLSRKRAKLEDLLKRAGAGQVSGDPGSTSRRGRNHTGCPIHGFD